MMYLAGAINTRDTNIIPNIVSFFTSSGVYHCELVFSDGTAAIVTPEVIGFTKRLYEWYKWILIPLPMCDDDAEKTIKKQAELIFATNPKYDWFGVILGMIFGQLNDKNKWYCSEMCLELLRPYIPSISTYQGFITPDQLCKYASDEITANYPEYLPLARLNK